MDVENKETCLPELRRDLLKYFCVYILMELGRVASYMILTQWKVNRELRHAEKSGLLEQEVTIKGVAKKVKRVPTYMDIQGKCFAPPQINAEYMELMTGFALIIYFGQVLPVMAFLYLVANMFEVRMLAYRYTRVTQRSKPQRAEGVGVWLYIFETITNTAIIIVPALSVFELHPLRNFPELTELQLFLGIEHVLLLINVFTHSRFYHDPYDVQEAQKFHTSLFDYLFSGKHIKPIIVEKWEELRGRPPAIGPTTGVEELEIEERTGDRWGDEE
jgi:hypothetical protein